MKYLLLSDTHSNLEAMEAVLAAADFDRAVFLGDAVDYGPDPEAVVDVLRGASKQGGALVRGNHDEGVATPEGEFDASWWSELATATMCYSRSRLAKGHLDFLGSLPATAALDLGAGGRALLCHGVPSSNREYLWPDLPDSKLAALLRGDTEGFTYLFAGHTHLPFERSLGPLRIANPGSVGQPRDRDPRASCAAFETDGEVLVLARVPYDVAAAQRAIVDRGMPVFEASRLAYGM